jgi:hypothetical protein
MAQYLQLPSFTKMEKQNLNYWSQLDSWQPTAPLFRIDMKDGCNEFFEIL